MDQTYFWREWKKHIANIKCVYARQMYTYRTGWSLVVSNVEIFFSCYSKDKSCLSISTTLTAMLQIGEHIMTDSKRFGIFTKHITNSHWNCENRLGGKNSEISERRNQPPFRKFNWRNFKWLKSNLRISKYVLMQGADYSLRMRFARTHSRISYESTVWDTNDIS